MKNLRDLKWRREQLCKLDLFLVEYEPKLLEALYQDLGKSAFESYATEIGLVKMEIRHALVNLSSWTRKKTVKTPLAHFMATSAVVAEPLGVVLILGPWNYPVQLILSPLVGAIAAGNCVVIKPSEMAPRVSSLLTKLDLEGVKIVEGDADASRELLAQRWDHIFFTGSPAVGKFVMQAAAQNLTPVTLELGGKCPCIVNDDIDVKLAAKRIVWGKFTNAGQTCVAPDYVLVHEGVRDQFILYVKHWICEFYGDDPRQSSDYGRIVSENHVKRLAKLVDGADFDLDVRYFAPTIVCEPDENSPLMQEEIFGPILPILSIKNLDQAIQFVNVREKPLTLYFFSNSSSLCEKIEQSTSSGSLVFNDTLSHVASPYLPFGGVGQSGMGKYHGEASFRAFSHMKSIFSKSTSVDLPVRYPPSNTTKLNLARRLI